MIDNVHSVFLLTQWAKKTGALRFIYTSTIGILDSSKDGEKVSETYSVSPASLYGMTKYLGEVCVGVSGLKHIILRFPYIYGPGDSNSAIANIIRSVSAGKSTKIRDERRDFLYVDDAVSALVSALQYNGKEIVFNIDSGNLTSMKKIVEMVMRIIQRDVNIRIEGTRNNLATDFSFASRELKWSPSYELQNGLEKQVEFLT